MPMISAVLTSATLNILALNIKSLNCSLATFPSSYREKIVQTITFNLFAAKYLQENTRHYLANNSRMRVFYSLVVRCVNLKAVDEWWNFAINWWILHNLFSMTNIAAEISFISSNSVGLSVTQFMGGPDAIYNLVNLKVFFGIRCSIYSNDGISTKKVNNKSTPIFKLISQPRPCVSIYVKCKDFLWICIGVCVRVCQTRSFIAQKSCWRHRPSFFKCFQNNIIFLCQ